jgi:hypothetical protein
MTEPARVDEVLALTRQALTPSAALRERVQARLQASALPAGALGTAGAPERTSGSGVFPGRRVSGGLMLGGTLLALGFVMGYGLRPDAGEPPPLPRRVGVPAVTLSAPVPDVEEPVPGARPALPSEGPRPPVRKASRAAAPVQGGLRPQPDDAPLSVPTGGRGAELELLQRAERAVRAGNTAVALMLTDELEARYPRSELLEERRAIELMAYCVARASDARPRAERFLRDHPRSVYAERITALCRVEPGGSEPPPI